MRLAFRPATSDSDKRFVLSSWLDASRTSYSSGLIQMQDWYAVMWPQLEKARTRDGMQTLVAYEATDPDFLYGFIVADPSDQRVPDGDSVHYHPGLVLFVFVKQNFRREGIARRLFAEVGIDPNGRFIYGCNTKTASKLSSKVPQARFAPLVARFPKEKAA